LIDRDGDKLIPVTDLGLPFVWLDWDPYPFDPQGRNQRRKQCAFNLYVAGMFGRALAPLCMEFGDEDKATLLNRVAHSLVRQAVVRFWHRSLHLFVDNLPWKSEEGGLFFSDRTLSHAVLFDHCPNGLTGASIEALATCPKEMGLSYPANALWRLRALAKS
jgi:alpha-L-rhamnosidase